MGSARTRNINFIAFSHFADNLYRFFLNLLTVLSAEEAFAARFVRIFRAGWTCSEPAVVGRTFRPDRRAVVGAAVDEQ